MIAIQPNTPYALLRRICSLDKSSRCRQEGWGEEERGRRRVKRIRKSNVCGTNHKENKRNKTTQKKTEEKDESSFEANNAMSQNLDSEGLFGFVGARHQRRDSSSENVLRETESEKKIKRTRNKRQKNR